MKRKLAENLKRVEERIQAACARADRPRESVTLVAVTKSLSLDVIRIMVDLGFTDLGESRVQELTRRAAAIDEWLGRRARDFSAGAKPRPRWHMVGHLQRNKIKTLLPWVDTIHSVDSLRLAEDLHAFGAKTDRIVHAFVEVNIAEDPNKHGVRVAAAFHLVDIIDGLDNLKIIGLMGMAPHTDDENEIRQAFTRLKEVHDEIVDAQVASEHFKCLSMGMSNDFEIAIELGATHVRVGTALFAGIEVAPYAVPAE